MKNFNTILLMFIIFEIYHARNDVFNMWVFGLLAIAFGLCDLTSFVISRTKYVPKFTPRR